MQFPADRPAVPINSAIRMIPRLFQEVTRYLTAARSRIRFADILQVPDDLAVMPAHIDAIYVQRIVQAAPGSDLLLPKILLISMLEPEGRMTTQQ